MSRTIRVLFSMRAAPAVGAAVKPGREELVEQVAVGGMDLDPVEAGLLCPKGRLAVGLDRVCDVRLRHLATPRLLGAAFKRRGQGRLPRELRAGQKASVGKLQDDPAALAMDGIRHPGKPGDEIVAVNAELAPHRNPLGPDKGMARDDEPHPSFGEPFHEPDELIGAAAVGRSKAFPGGRADETVGQFQGTDLRGLEKDGIAHANPRSVHFVGSPVDKAPAPDM